ncbi:MAG: hypothetical protein J6D16_03455 [Clostridia bacterium]|nr:hypothetical protein [Clostridia bacterium]
MKPENREMIQRAIGIIEGASWGANARVQDALAVAVEMLDGVLKEESK